MKDLIEGGWIMLQRVLLYSGVVVLFVVMLLVMNIRFLIEGPIGSDVTVPSLFGKLHRQVGAEDWNQAQNTHKQLRKTWSRFLTQAQISLEKSEVAAFEEQLIRLQTALEFSDKAKAIEEIRLMSRNWLTLGQ
jgi:hypothetical protein